MPFNLDEKHVIAAETKLGARLPASYREKMMTSNGGAVRFETGQPPPDHESCWWLHPILDTSDRKRLKRTCNDIVSETETRIGDGHPNWPDGAVEIGSDGCGNAYVFLRQGDAFGDQVFFWDHETGELELAAGDFSELRF